jgi:hypothetical protein
MGTEFVHALRVWRQHNDNRSATTIPRIRAANMEHAEKAYRFEAYIMMMMLMMLCVHDVA